MATRIRLRRVGRKRQASFRIVVAGSVHPRDGRASETIGKYNPRTQPSYIEIDEARALHWLREGAEVSESVRPLFRQAGILQKFAEGAEGEGVKIIGDPQGKTILAGQAQAPVAEPPEADTEKKAKPSKKAEATAESVADEKPEEAPKAKGKAAAEAGAEAATEARAEAATGAETAAEPGDEGEAESEPAAEAKTKTKGKAAGETKSKSKGKAAAAKGDTEAEADEAEAAGTEDEKQEG